MKKIITILITIICITGYSQTTTTVSIKKVSPDSVCIFDTIAIKFTYKLPPIVTNTLVSFKLQFGAMGNTICWQNSYTILPTLPTEIIGVDTCRIIKVIIPSGYGTGNCRVEAVQSINSYYIIWVNNCYNVTSIREYSNQTEQKAIYFDLQGLLIEKQYNVPMIEQKGLNMRKIYISN